MLSLERARLIRHLPARGIGCKVDDMALLVTCNHGVADVLGVVDGERSRVRHGEWRLVGVAFGVGNFDGYRLDVSALVLLRRGAEEMGRCMLPLLTTLPG